MLDETLSVAIVDDSDEIRALMSVVLQQELGIECVSVGCFTDLISQRSRILSSKVVILDIYMGPDQPDGVDIAGWLQRNEYQGKVVFLTGYGKGTPQVARALESGLDIFQKPLAVDELLSLLRPHLGRA